MSYNNRTVFITGGSRGIGKAIAMKLARENANIVIASKSTTAQPKLEGTIYSAAEEISMQGNGRVLALPLDVRDEAAINWAVEQAVATFGGIDVLINNASAINLAPTSVMDWKRYNLMQDINVRGSFFMAKACIPHLKKAANPHILHLSPPINMDDKWFGQHLGYTISKYGMSMVVKGLATELKADSIGVNALWPRTTIATAAVQNLLGGDALVKKSRTTDIVADAAFYILNRPSDTCTGNFFIDEEVLKAEGMNDFSHYAVDNSEQLMDDFFL